VALPLKIDVLPEPQLEFANAARDVDPRGGLGTHGPVDDRGLRSIRLGLVGLPEDIEAAKVWLNRFKQFIAAFEANSNRFRDWPGLQEALNCRFLVEEAFVRTVEPSVYNTLFPHRNGPSGRPENGIQPHGSSLRRRHARRC
jgi:hypothetical protein